MNNFFSIRTHKILTNFSFIDALCIWGLWKFSRGGGWKPHPINTPLYTAVCTSNAIRIRIRSNDIEYGGIKITTYCFFSTRLHKHFKWIFFFLFSRFLYFYFLLHYFAVTVAAAAAAAVSNPFMVKCVSKFGFPLRSSCDHVYYYTTRRWSANRGNCRRRRRFAGARSHSRFRTQQVGNGFNENNKT